MKSCTPASSHIPTSAAHVAMSTFLHVISSLTSFLRPILFYCLGNHFEWPKWQPYANIFQINLLQQKYICALIRVWLLQCYDCCMVSTSLEGKFTEK